MGTLVSDAKGNIYGPTTYGGTFAGSIAPEGGFKRAFGR
jgi:hypothetical protein